MSGHSHPAGNAPIGVFDSGVGGLTVLAAIAHRLPQEDLVYVGDTARVPYGTKSAETVNVCAREIAHFLVQRGVKALVVACNTASATALPALRAEFDIPILGVVDPGARAAAEATRNGRVGVISTEATLASGAYPAALRKEAGALEIFSRACPLFVPLAEEGWVDNEVTRSVVARYLGELKGSEIDTLLLGCTHYPLLAPAIRAYFGDTVEVVDSAVATAGELARTLSDKGLLAQSGAGAAEFFVTDVPDRFILLGERFYGSSVASAVRVSLRELAGFAGTHAAG